MKIIDTIFIAVTFTRKHIQVIFLYTSPEYIMIMYFTPVVILREVSGKVFLMKEFIQNYADILDFGLNLLQLFALIASIFTFFFFMVNRYAKALEVILYPYGLSFFQKVRILFICRKSPDKKRAFIEYAILESKGYHLPPAQWRNIIRDFKTTFYSETKELSYTIPNCTLLIGDGFSAIADRYFDYFSNDSVRSTFGIDDDRIKWVIKIHIDEAYITPTFLLTGLISQYEENWSEFIKRFVSTSYITDENDADSNIILPNELYLTFAWLLWGPSYEIQYSSNRSILCQLSFGDESNSLPIFTSSEENLTSELVKTFNDTTQYGYGALASLDLSLYKSRPFIKSIRQSVSPKYNYFYDKIENSDTSFALQIDSFKPYQGFRAQSYYCTAYVWILFELIDENSSEFHPETSLAFFEHTNLTNMQTYHFLTNMLIEKSIRHFEVIFSEEKYRNRKYRFVCAMNKRIEEALREAYQKRIECGDALSSDFASRIELTPQRSPSEVFATFDEFFMPNGRLSFIELNADDKTSLIDLGVFYADIYIDAFPNEDERETYDNLLRYLKQTKTAKDYTYHIILAKNESGQIVAGAIFDYFKASNSGMVEFIAVKQNLQSAGYGSLLYNHIFNILDADAHKFSGDSLSFIFCEIDIPELGKSKDAKYLHFWDKHNYKRIDMNYVQPQLSSSQRAVDGLWLTVTSPRKPISEISSDQVSSVIRDYMKYCMGISEPSKNSEYKQMLKDLNGRKRLRLTKIL